MKPESPDSDRQLPAVEFRGVSFSFDDAPVLDQVSFELGRGQMIVITGASGSGKSVLLRLAVGLMHPDSGQILVDGTEISGLPEDELLEIRSRSLGLVFQEDTLFTGMSVYENTAYRLTEHGWSEADTDRAVKEILTFVGLAKDVDKLPEELSIGMGRRLELARALVGWPSIMFFDEPTSGLDPINARQVLDLIILARDAHEISSLVVTKELHQIPHLVHHQAIEDETGEVTIQRIDGTHDPNVKVMVLEKGEIAFFGSPEEFQNSTLPAVVYLTHPETGLHMSDEYFRDPWSSSRKKKD